MLEKILSCFEWKKETAKLNPAIDCKQKITALTNGIWFVSHYFDNISDETDKFNSYNFTFHQEGKITVFNYEISYEGTWELSTNGKKLRITLPPYEPLIDLDDLWVIQNHTSNRIILVDDKIQSNEKLHFDRKWI